MIGFFIFTLDTLKRNNHRMTLYTQSNIQQQWRLIQTFISWQNKATESLHHHMRMCSIRQNLELKIINICFKEYQWITCISLEKISFIRRLIPELLPLRYSKHSANGYKNMIRKSFSLNKYLNEWTEDNNRSTTLDILEGSSQNFGRIDFRSNQ